MNRARCRESMSESDVSERNRQQVLLQQDLKKSRANKRRLVAQSDLIDIRLIYLLSVSLFSSFFILLCIFSPHIHGENKVSSY